MLPCRRTQGTWLQVNGHSLIEMRTIFVTNDDGIHSPGLGTLAAHLARSHARIVVAAPEDDMSGTGTAINIPGAAPAARSIRIKPHPFADNPRIDAHSVSGTPALVVLLAHRGVFGSRPELIVAGPNLGANTGHDVQHSGTVGAAIAAVRHGTHAIALSLAVRGAREPLEPHWDTAARIACCLLDEILAGEFDDPVLANVNVPDAAFDEIRGIRAVGLAADSGFRLEGFDEVLAADGSRELRPKLAANTAPAGIDTDIGALRAGFVTVTWLRLPGLTHGGGDGLRDLHRRASLALGLPT